MLLSGEKFNMAPKVVLSGEIIQHSPKSGYFRGTNSTCAIKCGSFCRKKCWTWPQKYFFQQKSCFFSKGGFLFSFLLFSSLSFLKKTLSLYLSLYLSISIYLYIYMSLSLSLSLSSLSLSLSIYLFYLSLSLSISLSLYIRSLLFCTSPLVSLSFSLSPFLSLSLVTPSLCSYTVLHYTLFLTYSLCLRIWSRLGL